MHIVVDFVDDFRGKVSVVAVVVVYYLLFGDEVEEGKRRLRVVSLHFLELRKKSIS